MRDKEAHRAASREWKRRNAERNREYQKVYNQRYRLVNKDSIAFKKWVGILHRKYRLSLADFEALVLSQSNQCAICGKSFEHTKLVIDHCHKTGRVRGLLCDRCNVGIGRLFDDPIIVERALNYLRKK